MAIEVSDGGRCYENASLDSYELLENMRFKNHQEMSIMKCCPNSENQVLRLGLKF